MQALYRIEIDFFDAAFGRLLTVLAESGLEEKGERNCAAREAVSLTDSRSRHASQRRLS